MRSFTIAFLGATFVYLFFWYRGDVGTIELGPFEFKPPAERPLLDKLRQLQEEARAIGGGFAPRDENAVTLSSAPQFYAGQLIVKPRESVRARNLAGAETFAVSSSARAAANALAAAQSVGDVERAGGDTLLVNLDYDLAPPQAASGDSAQPLSFNGRWRARAQAGRERPRALFDVGAACPEGGLATADDPSTKIACAIEQLEASGQFDYVEKNFIVTHEMGGGGRPVSNAPTDPLYGLQWHYLPQGGGLGESRGGAGFEAFWSRARQTGSRDVVVAVVDTGLDLSHPDIAASGNVAPGVDMVSVPFYGNDGDGRDLDPNDPGDQCDPSDPTTEDSFHGTHVAGIIGAAATDNGDGIAGGAWNVTVVPVRAVGRCGGLQSDINDAIRWAAGVEPTIVEDPDGGTILYANPNPANIINLSLGFRAPDGCPASTQDAINDAVAAGAIVVAAAGNAGINVDRYGPSGCENVIAVSAGDAVGQLAHYSNWGSRVDIMAPGGDLRADLNRDGQPDGILSTKRRKNCIDPVTRLRVSSCRYSWENGTSMAAPHVSAGFALLKSQYPRRTNEQLVELLTERARTPRTADQCTLPCGVGGGDPLPGGDNICFRPCGAGLLDLGKAIAQ